MRKSLLNLFRVFCFAVVLAPSIADAKAPPEGTQSKKKPEQKVMALPLVAQWAKETKASGHQVVTVTENVEVDLAEGRSTCLAVSLYESMPEMNSLFGTWVVCGDSVFSEDELLD